MPFIDGEGMGFGHNLQRYQDFYDRSDRTIETGLYGYFAGGGAVITSGKVVGGGGNNSIAWLRPVGYGRHWVEFIQSGSNSSSAGIQWNVLWPPISAGYNSFIQSGTDFVLRRGGSVLGSVTVPAVTCIVRIEAKGPIIQVFVNGTPRIVINDTGPVYGRLVGLRVDTSGDIFDNFRCGTL